jgi:hypothetical protein
MICYGKFIANINRRQGAYVEPCGIDQRRNRAGNEGLLWVDVVEKGFETVVNARLIQSERQTRKIDSRIQLV